MYVYKYYKAVHLPVAAEFPWGTDKDTITQAFASRVWVWRWGGIDRLWI
ncbi:hypothetical protein [Microseira wollei]|uniref:Uncharacterized protein n=1 Tax=Microseira wollei NIES-4236 TaxID=2530354 RepID=A0AAV3X4G5_9CYAN|nr:hypothetical protein [Microseira wollei]GET36963.1 hypothetical protein MiSe_17160 [Microseira wollei NIES-4236]